MDACASGMIARTGFGRSFMTENRGYEVQTDVAVRIERVEEIFRGSAGRPANIKGHPDDRDRR
jgi:hypothetical protein